MKERMVRVRAYKALTLELFVLVTACLLRGRGVFGVFSPEALRFGMVERSVSQLLTASVQDL